MTDLVPQEPPDNAEPSDPPQAPSPTEALGVPSEVLEHLPEPAQQMLQLFAASGSFPIQNPMLAQVRPEHISAVLENQGKIASFQHTDNHENRLLAGFVLIVAVVLVLVLALSGHSADLTLVLQYGIPFAGGVGLGFGVSEYRRRE
jgi:hypothetical protein